MLLDDSALQDMQLPLVLPYKATLQYFAIVPIYKNKPVSSRLRRIQSYPFYTQYRQTRLAEQRLKKHQSGQSPLRQHSKIDAKLLGK
jgi:hypothetical protein